MVNTVNTGSLATLTAGNSLLVHARRVNGGKVQLELAEIIESADRGATNVLGMFNKSDDRFSAGGARRAWLTAEPTDASNLLGIDLSTSNPAWMTDDQGREILPLNVLNPQVNGNTLRVRIVETTEPSSWQAQNIERAAKRAGADGPFILHGGKYIFSNTEVVFNEAKHLLLEADEQTTSVSGSSILGGLND